MAEAAMAGDVGLDPSSIINSCSVCNSTQNLMRCSACKSVWYCGKAHQTEHWSAHKFICRQARAAADQVNKDFAGAESNKTAPRGPAAASSFSSPSLLKELAEAGKDVDSDDEDGANVEAEVVDSRAAGGADDGAGIGDESPGIPEEGAEVDIGVCAIHEAADASGYVHALNNMAGKHQIDLPLSFFERFNIEEEKAQTLLADWTLGSGLCLLAGAKKRRMQGSVGTGILVQGPMRIGIALRPASKSASAPASAPSSDSSDSGPAASSDATESDAVVVYEWSGRREVVWTNETGGDVRVSDHLVLHPGACIDAFCVIYGPLTYRNRALSTDGGVHYNGCAFACHGKNRAQNSDKFYRELCIQKKDDDTD